MKIRQLLKNFCLGAMVLSFIPTICHADVNHPFESGTTDTIIPDYVTVNPQTTVDPISITAAEIAQIGPTGRITNITFTIANLNHDWLGDLTASVRHTDSNGVIRSAPLFHRVGITEANGTPGIQDQNGEDVNNNGDNSNFLGSYRFEDNTSSLWDTAQNASLGDNDVVPSLNDQEGVGFYAASGPNNVAVSLMNVFGGDANATNLNSIIGTWDVLISDRNNLSGNTVGGSFVTTGMVVTVADPTVVPEPSALAMFAMLGLGTLRRRRNSK